MMYRLFDATKNINLMEIENVHKYFLLIPFVQDNQFHSQLCVMIIVLIKKSRIRLRKFVSEKVTSSRRRNPVSMSHFISATKI